MPDRFEPAELGVVEKLPYLVRCVIIMKNTVDFYCGRMLLLTKV